MVQKTIRLKMPQWQGGNNPTYALGSELLAWLAPRNRQQKELARKWCDGSKLAGSNHSGYGSLSSRIKSLL